MRGGGWAVTARKLQFWEPSCAVFAETVDSFRRWAGGV